MRFQIGFVLVSLLMLTLSVMAVSVPKGDFGIELSSLVEKSRIEQKKCDDLHEKAEKAGGEIKETADSQEVFFSSKKVAMRVLRVLNGYPGIPISTKKAMVKIRNNYETKEKFDLELLFRLGDCQTVGFYTLWKRLIGSAKIFGFSASEKKELSIASLNYLKKDVASPLTLIGVSVRIAVLDELTQQELIKLSKAKQKELTLLKERAKQIKTALRKQSHKWDWLTKAKDKKEELSAKKENELFRLLHREIRDTESLRNKFGEIISVL